MLSHPVTEGGTKYGELPKVTKNDYSSFGNLNARTPENYSKISLNLTPISTEHSYDLGMLSVVFGIEEYRISG